MLKTDVAIVGAGPAGLSAAIKAASFGADVIILERDKWLGGQLVKQTHSFFGSKNEYAGIRGIDIANIFADELEKMENVQIMLETPALGYYEDNILTAYSPQGKMLKIKPNTLIFATGAMEKMIPFENNDLPGIYGAGAVQTLMNVYGVVPGENVLMIGAGNIGLIVSYQLVQAGVDVAAIVEALPEIGGYWVHASKVRRMGIPILTNHSIIKALGKEQVQGAVVAQIDEKWQPVKETAREFQVDTICLSVGLSPLIELLWQSGCHIVYSKELGGYVPILNEDLETTVPGIYVAGDASGIEEATSAIIEGHLTGCAAAKKVGYEVPKEEFIKARKGLESLRAGPVSQHIRKGLSLIRR